MKKRRATKKVGRAWVFIILAFIVALTTISFFGIKNWYGDTENVYFKSASDIRWGIDIQGGVEAVFSPDTDKEVTEDQLNSAKAIIETRLIEIGVTDYETSVDTHNSSIIVRFPWQAGEQNFDATNTIKQLGDMAVLTFCGGSTYDKDKILLTGATDIDRASATYEDGSPVVSLKLTSSGRDKFSAVTAKKMATDTPESEKYIAICMDETVVSAPKVQSVITNGQAVITGISSYEECQALASKINSGSLPFAMSVDDSKLQVISATLGAEALNTMLIAGLIAFAVICVIIIVRYRLPGLIACFALAGQVGGIIACVSGFFPGTDGFTLTIPGIAGIILSIGMGIDANVITAERIREELRGGKTVTSAINAGCNNAMSAIVDGNLTNILVAIVLMGCFGPSENIFAKIFSPIMEGLFGASVSGAVYSFGFTQLIGVLFNFIMGVFATKIMLKSIAGFKCMRKPWLYGGVKHVEE